jgi:transposase-like protein
VSARKAEKIAESLGIEIGKSKVSRLCAELSKAVQEFRERPLGEFPYACLDAAFPKAREGGHVRSMALAAATGVDPGGARHILGMETGELWNRLLRGLCSRGLRAVRLAASDAHSGLKAAVDAVASGLCCKAHFLRSALAEAPKAQRGLAAAMARTVFLAGSKEEAKAQLRLVALQMEKYFQRQWRRCLTLKTKFWPIWASKGALGAAVHGKCAGEA